MRRVYVTGIGVVSPIGHCKDEFWQNLLAGKSGIGRLETIDLTDLPITIGGEVRGLDFTRANINDKVNSRKMDRSSVFGVVATQEALGDAKLGAEEIANLRSGIVLGSGLAGLVTLQEQTENLLKKGPRGVSPFTIPVLMPNAAPANISMAFGIRGTNYTVVSACASAGHAMIDAFEMLRHSELDFVITGGTEASITRLAISAFANMKAMTKKFNDTPTKASRPFDSGRDGFVMSEGSTILIFEGEDSVQRRGVKPYAEIVGFGSTSDSYHLVQPDPEAKGATQAIRDAVSMAGWNAAEIGPYTYVNAHGTSTKFNDAAETLALKTIFQSSAEKLRVSSTKSTTGHLIGAAAAIEMAACSLALTHQILPPTINYENPDPACDLDYVPNEARPADIRFALNDSFGFGGHNVCLAVRRVES